MSDEYSLLYLIVASWIFKLNFALIAIWQITHETAFDCLTVMVMYQIIVCLIKWRKTKRKDKTCKNKRSTIQSLHSQPIIELDDAKSKHLNRCISHPASFEITSQCPSIHDSTCAWPCSHKVGDTVMQKLNDTGISCQKWSALWQFEPSSVRSYPPSSSKSCHIASR